MFTVGMKPNGLENTRKKFNKMLAYPNGSLTVPSMEAPTQPRLTYFQLCLSMAIQSAEREGFTGLAGALAEILREDLGL